MIQRPFASSHFLELTNLKVPAKLAGMAPDKAVETILIAEDDSDIRDLLEYNLKQDGFKTVSVERGDQVLEAAKRHKPDLILLDLMMPGMSGVEACKRLRAGELTARIPIIMVTAKVSETDKIVGLELGADDYVTKPFSPKEVVARVRALLRRAKSNGVQKEVLTHGPLSIDLTNYKVQLDKQEIGLTLTEYKLLRELLTNLGRVLSRGELTSTIMGSEVSVTDRTIDVHLASLRKKMGMQADLIETVRGVGYRFKE